jgi:23S rRNA pseudouridine1911/1915/1917 synthase
MRIDRYIAERLGLFSRSQARSRVVRLLVNGRDAKPARRLKVEDELEIHYDEPAPLSLVPQEMPLDILYEDPNVIVLNKPQGLVVHPGAGHFSGTLVHGLLHHIDSLRERFPGEPLRPGIVHRLDKDTSGVIVAAKHPDAQEFLARQFREHRVSKRYVAVVRGVPQPPRGKIRTFLHRDPRHRQRFTWTPAEGREGRGRRTPGRVAVTFYRVLRTFGDSALLSLRPQTGRTHQLRVHMLSIGCPILGDPLYGRRGAAGPPLMLHAYRLAITLPGEDRPRIFRAPLPQRFTRYLHTRGRPPADRDAADRREPEA